LKEQSNFNNETRVGKVLESPGVGGSKESNLLLKDDVSDLDNETRVGKPWSSRRIKREES
jgi:hypothetical protein